MFEEWEKLDPERSGNEGFAGSFQYLLRPVNILVCEYAVRGEYDDGTNHANKTYFELANTLQMNVDTY